MKWRRIMSVSATAAILGTAVWASAAATVNVDIPVNELAPHYEKNRSVAPPYTLAMLELGMRMGAAITDVRRGDAARVKISVASLREQYAKVAALVPSWKGYFANHLLDELEKAGSNGADLKTKNEAIARFENNCTACHSRYMFPVQARFRWGLFADVEVQTDKKDDVSFHQLMLDLGNGLGTIRADVAAGQFDAARTMYEQVKERFTLMELACTNCHGEPREYFIDSRVKGRLLKIGGMLRKGSTGIADYNQLLNEINETSCFPCHQVHMPAAFLQRNWSGK